jgi:hypothetical protein
MLALLESKLPSHLTLSGNLAEGNTGSELASTGMLLIFQTLS